jgi:hypothetical protein
VRHVLCISLHTNTHFTHAHPPLVNAREWSKKNCVSLCHMPSLQLSRRCQHGAQCQWPRTCDLCVCGCVQPRHPQARFNLCATVYLFVRLHDDVLRVLCGVLCSEWLSHDELWCDVTCCDVRHCAALCCAACVSQYVWTPALAASCFVVFAVVYVASAFRCTPVHPRWCCTTHD